MAERKDITNKYLITSGGKEEEYNAEKVDNYGVVNAAKNLFDEGATIRMRDKDGSDYDIPLTEYDQAVSGGLRPFVLRRETVYLPEHKEEPIAPAQAQAPEVDEAPVAPQRNIGVLGHGVMGAQTFNETPEEEKRRKAEEQQFKEKYEREKDMRDAVTSQMDETYEALEKRRGEIEDEVRDEQNARYLAAYSRKVPYALRKKNTAEEPPVVGDPRNIRTKEEGEAYNKSVIQDIEAREKESENERVRREELQAIGAGQRKIEATRDMLGAVERNVQDENVKNALMGVYDTAKRMSTWDFGATNVGDAATMIDVTNKMSRGEALTEAEDEMLTAMATSQLLNEAYGSHVGVMYEVGQSIPQSVGFMIALATNPASGAGKAFQAWALKKFGRAGAGKLMRKLASYTARGVGDVAEAAAASLTTGGGITAANILNERLGTTQYKAGEDGVEYAGQADQKSMGAIGGLLFDDDWDGRSIGQWLGGDAMGLGLKNSVIENYTEMAGEYFAPLSKYMRNGTSKMFRVAAGKEGRLGLDRVADFLEVAPSKKFDRLLGRYRYKTLEEAMHFNGVVGETLEEELGMMLDAVLPGGDANMKWFGFNPPKEGTPEYNEYQNSMFNWHNQLVTVLSVAAMTPLFSGAGKVQQHFREKPLMDAVDGLFNAYGVDESRDRNNESVPAKIREELASMKPTDAADKIMELVNNGTIQNDDQLRATMQYAGAAIAYQTGTVNHNYNMANDADPVTKMANEAFSAGTNVAPDKAYNAYSGLADARENLESVGGKEMVDIVDGFGVQDDEEFSAYLNSITDTALRTAAQRYWLNKNRAWGYQWKTEDDAERAEDKARRDARIHAKENNSGVLYFTTGIYNGNQVYVEGSTGNTTTIFGEDGVPEMVPTSLVTDIKNTRLENAADGIRDAIVAERNAAFTRHPRTEEPRVGLVLHTPEDGDIIISRIDDDGTIWYQSATIDGNTGEWKPAGGVPGRIAEAAVYDLQNEYYRQQDRNSAEGQLQAQAEEESVVQVDEQIKQPLTGSAKFRDELNAMGDAGVDAAEMVDDMIDKGYDAETIHKFIANGTGEGVTETANRYADARLAEINAAGAQQTEAEAQQAAEDVAAVQTPIQTQNMPAEFGEVQQRWQGANKIVGGVHFYTMPKSGGEKKATRLKGHYVLVEQGAATASHDPHTFEPVPGLTDENGQTWNSRDYKGNSENQRIVNEIGANYGSAALDNAPIVSSDGVVWSGNNRVMSGQLAAENGTDKDYIEALAESAEAFGFTEEQVRGMQHPRVYFVPDAESAQAAGLGYDRLSFGRFNAADQKVSSAIEVGAELGKSIKPGTFQRLADIISGYETGLKGLLANKKSKGAKQVIDALIDAEEVSMAGSINKSQFYDENDGLTEDGEMLINAAFMGYIFSGDTETLARITSLKKKQMAAIAEAMPEITQNRTLGEGSLDDIIREAIRVVTEANKGRGTLDDYLNTMEFNFDGGAGRWNADVYGPVVSSIARAINGQGASLKGILASYNNSYGRDMFGNSSRDGIIRDILRNQGYDVAAAAPAQEAAPAAPTQEEAAPTQETPAAEQPANEMTEEEKQAADKKIKRDAVRQMFLQSDADNIGVADKMTDAEVDELNGLIDAWEPINDEMGQVQEAEAENLKSKDQSVKAAAQARVDVAEQKVNAAFAPVENYIKTMVAKYGEAPAAEETEQQPESPEASQTVPKVPSEASKPEAAKFSIDNPETWVGKTFTHNGMQLVCKDVTDGYAMFDNKTTFMGMGFDVPKVQEWLRGGQWKSQDEQQKQEPADDWQYEVHHDKLTGQASVTRSKKGDGGMPVQDDWEVRASSLTELREILGNPQNHLQDIYNAVEPQIKDKEVKAILDIAQRKPQPKSEGPVTTKLSDHGTLVVGGVPKAEEKKEDAYGANNTLVSTERYEELKKKMLAKLRGQLNVGFDPELLAMGAEMAAYHIEAGARSFADFVQRMVADMGDIIRPYLKAFYNGARDMPGMEEMSKEMTPYDEVSRTNVTSIRQNAPVSEENAEESSEETENNVNLQQEASEEAERRPEDADKYRAFSQAVEDDMLAAMETGEKPYRNIGDIRKKAREIGLDVDDEGRTDILLQELVEDGLVKAARQYVNNYVIQQVLAGKDLAEVRRSRDLFNDVVQLYNLQPTIARRSSNRVKMQQYSTPLPMSFVADVFAYQQGMKDVLEPTAGNGMMVFAVPEFVIHANELDATRLDNLRAQKFKKVSDRDATEPFEDDVQYDGIIANPPFGSAEAKMYDGKEIPGLAEQIALNALSKMKDNGRAAIIIGGNMEYSDNGAIKNKKAFFTYLYDHYNVKGVIDMDGKLYQRQGTTYPTRMILIDGRRSEEERAQARVFPPTKDNAPRRANSFEELYEIAEEIRTNNNKTNGTTILRSSTGTLLSNDSNASGNTVREGHRGQHSQNDTNGSGRTDTGRGNTGVGTRPSTAEERPSGVGREGVLQPGNAGLASNQEDKSQPGRASQTDNEGGSAGSNGGVRHGDVQRERPVVSGVGVERPEEKRKLGSDKLSYRRHNTGRSLESVAPAAMVEAMDENLKRIEDEVGNIDEWIASELGYDTTDALHDALAAEQIDSVAMAIYQMKHGQAMIIGDQTGVGKGRQMAALIRWARRQGKRPIFITKSDDLFSDIYRDLADIGSGELRPFIFNASVESENKETGEKSYTGGVMTDNDGKLVYRSPGKKVQDKIFASGVLPDEYDFAVLTYSQVNTGDEISREEAKESAKSSGERYQKSKKKNGERPTPKPTFLRAIAKDNYMFLDESHNAAGKSNTGFYFQSIIKTAEGVTFASATFAKRPDTMPMYALRTAMSKAKVKTNELIDIIERGGVTLQEIMSRALTQAGQMVRRERDMSDVVTDWKTVDDPETVRTARDNYDKTIEAFNAIIDFQRNYVAPHLNALSQSLSSMASSAGARQGTEDLGISNVPFASKTYNYTKQLMLALKVDAIVDETVKEIEAGRHPVIALENTMGSLLGEYKPGDTITDTTFAASLLKGLRGVLRYTVKDEDNKEQQLELTPEQLGPEGEAAYRAVEELIKESTRGVFVSPLDAITEKLQARGYRVGELTGRSTVAVFDSETGEYKVETRKDKDKKKLARDFNNGALDVLILNKSAATGISLHAFEKFSDQRQRTMIIAQPLADINDYMQMIGRIDRTGQVHRGYYINLGLPVPAENRFLMMLATKLKSLNANTTTSQESESNDVEAPDLLNKYGSRVVVEYLRDNPDIYVKMGEPLKKDKSQVKASALDEYEPQEDDARKITGYVALLTTAEQDAFYDDVVRRYNDLITYLNDTGGNDLKISVLPLRAKTIERQVSSVGANPDSGNPFANDAYVELIEMDVLKKPMKAAEIRKTIEKLNPAVEVVPDVVAFSEAQRERLGRTLTPRIRQILSVVARETQAKLDKEEARYNAATTKAEEDIAKKAETIRSQQKRTEEEKQDAIDKFATEKRASVEEVHDSNVRRIEHNNRMLVEFITKFTVGEPAMIPDDLTTDMFSSSVNGIFCGIKAKDSGITPSTTFAVFCTLDGRRKVEIKLTDTMSLLTIERNTEDNWDAAHRVTLDNWDSQIPSETRTRGYMMTGNILQAFSDVKDNAGYFPGHLVTFTDIDGNVRDGILMNARWQPSQLRSTNDPIAMHMEDVKSLKNGEHIISADKRVVIERSLKDYTLSVPTGKKPGGEFFEDDRLLDLIDGVFYENGGQFRADVPIRNIDAVVERLSELGVQVKSDREVKFENDTTAEQRVSGEVSAPSEEEVALRDALRDVMSDFGNELINAPAEVQAAARAIKSGAKEMRTPGFFSNATRAVEGIKQEKATPEQWLAMIQKAGGIKAGEDKWTGLSDWLKGQTKKTLTKQEVLDYLFYNRVQLEEVHYGERRDINEDVLQMYVEKFRNLKNASEREDELGRAEDALAQMIERYGRGFDEAFDIENKGDEWLLVPNTNWDGEYTDEAKMFLGAPEAINSTRLRFTTEGLEEKREVALTVPTVEPYHGNLPEVHFDDPLTEGKTIAWVRFGDTTTSLNGEVGSARIMDELEEKYGNPDAVERMTDEDAARRFFANYIYRIGIGNREDLKRSYDEIQKGVGEERSQNVKYLFDVLVRRSKVGRRVLVIDEIQSQRHQDAREVGYKDTNGSITLSALRENGEGEQIADILDKNGKVLGVVRHIDGDGYYAGNTTFATTFAFGEGAKWVGPFRFKNEAVLNFFKVYGGVPDAPLEKNWHELAMKRILRLAAEEGYDKLAWTTGKQQAERYDIGGAVDSIYNAGENSRGLTDIDINLSSRNGGIIHLQVDKNGEVKNVYNDSGDLPDSPYIGKNLSEIIGKDFAERVMNLKDGKEISGEGLRVGGDGMRGFYDEMLPRFMDKYGKKWGVKTHDIELPNLEEAGRTMHAIDITPEMRRSVMEGQPMFMRTNTGHDVYGFTYKGKIYYDESIATAETLIHEYTHMWAEALRHKNPAAWGRLGEQMLDGDLYDYVKSLYPELKGNDLLEEVFAHFSGRRGEARLRAEQARLEKEARMDKAAIRRMFDKLRKLLTEFWEQARNLFAGKIEGIENISAEDFADMVLNDILSGFDPRTEMGGLEEEAQVHAHKIADPYLITKLESEPTVKRYRAMALIDGKLYPPMTIVVDGKMRDAASMNRWEQSDETPFDFSEEQMKEMRALEESGKPGVVNLVPGKLRYIRKTNGGKAVLQFNLKKNKKDDMWVAYNPYFHTSTSPLNDQFTSAYNRPELVVAEVEVPESELTAGYKAEGAKDGVGNIPWHSGTVNAKLPKDKQRTVTLSRYIKTLRVVPDSEIAEIVAPDLKASNISVPYNVVTPSLRDELKKQGVTIEGEPNNGPDEPNGGGTRFRKGEGAKGNSPASLRAVRRTVEDMVDKLNLKGRVLILNSAELLGNNDPWSARRAKSKGWYDTKTGKITLVLDNHDSLSDIWATLLHEGVAHFGLRELVGEDNFNQFLDDIYNNTEDDVHTAIDNKAKELSESENGKHDAEHYRRVATEEYMAELAETMLMDDLDSPSIYFPRLDAWWANIKQAFLDMMGRLGFGEYFNHDIGDNELRYLLWRSYKNLSAPGQLRNRWLGNAISEARKEKTRRTELPTGEVRSFDEAAEDEVLFRRAKRVEAQLSPQASAMQRAYNAIMASPRFRAKEGLVDYLASLEEFQKLYEKHTGKKVRDSQNAYWKFLALSSKIKEENDLLEGVLLHPLSQAVYDLVGKKKLTNADFEKKGTPEWELSRYIKAKHGIERNRDMSVREYLKGNDDGVQLLEQYYDEITALKDTDGYKRLSWRKQQEALDAVAAKYGFDFTEDYSGMTEDFADIGGNIRPSIMDWVEQYEKDHGLAKTNALWQAIKGVTEFSLNRQAETGLMALDEVKKQQRRYDYFVPLRGFEDMTALDAYDYPLGTDKRGGNPVKRAKGRTSAADNPIASMINVAYRTINSGNKNEAAQALLDLCLGIDDDLVAVDPVWYNVLPDGTKVAAYPTIPDDATPDQINAILDRFEQDMEMKAAIGLAKREKGSTPKFPHRIMGGDELREHQVFVWVGGVRRTITFAGDPRVALAVNGELRAGNNAGIRSAVNSFMAGAFTSYNPSFALANLARDTFHANIRSFITEDPQYWWALTKKQNFGIGVPGALYDTAKMLFRYSGSRKNNSITPSNAKEKRFWEFMENGGATGYTFVRDQDASMEELRKIVMELHKGPAAWTKEVLVKMPMRLFQFCGEAAELTNRFAAYEVSRDMGRSIVRSVHDAKEITLNFNKRGAGVKSVLRKAEAKEQKGAGLANAIARSGTFGRESYVFFNARIQGAYQMYDMAKNHPLKFLFAYGAVPLTFSALALPMLNNALLPALYAACGVGGDDDDDKVDYFDALSDYTRAHNICFRLPGKAGWLKIPVTPEIATVFSWGDRIGQWLYGHKDLSPAEAGTELFKGLVDMLLPITINYNSPTDFVLSLAPSALRPGAELAINRDFMGRKWYKDGNGSEYNPRWMNAVKNESPTLIELSKRINRATQTGEEKTYADKGTLDIAPSFFRAFGSGYMGGFFNTALAAADAILSGIRGEGKQWLSSADIPVIGRFWQSGSKEKTSRDLYGQYYRDVVKFVKQMEHTDKVLYKDAEQDASKVDGYLDFAQSERYQKYSYLKPICDAIEEYTKGYGTDDLPPDALKLMQEARDYANGKEKK